MGVLSDGSSGTGYSRRKKQTSSQRQLLSKMIAMPQPSPDSSQQHWRHLLLDQDRADEDAMHHGSIRLPGIASARTHRESQAAFRLMGHPRDTAAFHQTLKLPSLMHGTEQASKGKPVRLWNVILVSSPKSEAGSTQGEHGGRRLAAQLQKALGMEAADAESLEGELQFGGSHLVEACGSRSDAVKRASALRDFGLMVRVTKRLERDCSPSARCSRVHGFAEQCRGTLRGDMMRLSRTINAGAKLRYDASWRLDVPEPKPILEPAEDAVEAFFLTAEPLESPSASTTSIRAQNAFAKMRSSGILTKVLSAEVPPTPAVASNSVARASAISQGISRSLSFEQQAEIKEEQSAPQPQIQKREHSSSSQPTTWRKARVANAASGWESEIVDAVNPNKKALVVWKEACRLMRVFVYGSFFGMRAPGELSEDDVYLQAVGTREEVEVLFSMWAELDRDKSGRVDYRELERFINVHVKGKAGKAGPAADFAHALLVKIERLLLQKKNSVAIEDFMRLIWPASEAQEIRQMKFWCRELAAQACQTTKIRPPTVLPKEDLDALCAIFRRMDTRKSGYVDFETMMENGIVHDYHVDQLRRDWDKNDSGSLDLLGFCEMMCPTGYRVHNLAQIGSMSDGTVVVFDPDERTWVAQDRSASELISGLLGR